MGIRFRCHHCDQLLNVKASQAGLTGICPHCRNPVLIVAQTDIHLESNSASSYVGMYDEDHQITESGLGESLEKPATEMAGQEAGQDETGATASRITKRFRGPYAGDEAKDVFLLDKPEVSPLVGVIDPIAENPKLVWYYRTKQVGERGPLKATQMQAEIESGRVGAGSVVWREDWEKWLPAERVFPQLNPARLSSEFSSEHSPEKSASGGINVFSNLRIGKQKALVIWGAMIVFALAVVILLVMLLKWILQ